MKFNDRAGGWFIAKVKIDTPIFCIIAATATYNIVGYCDFIDMLQCILLTFKFNFWANKSNI